MIATKNFARKEIPFIITVVSSDRVRITKFAPIFTQSGNLGVDQNMMSVLKASASYGTLR